MRILLGRLLISLALSVLFPCLLLAQGEGKPPECCSEDSVTTFPTTILISPPESISISPISQITVSDDSLAAQGITRSEFLESMATGLFPGCTVYLTLPIAAEMYDASGEVGLVTIYFQVPIKDVAPEVVDALDTLYVTDGEVFIQVFFLRTSAPAVP